MPPDQTNLPLPIVTPRLILDLPKPGDGAALAAAMRETWEALFPWFHRHLGPKDQETDQQRKEDFVVRAIADAAGRRRILLLGFDRRDGEFAVWSGFPNIDWRERRFEIDYWVRRSKQGRGFAQESVNACLRYAFSVMGARAVNLGCAATNKTSLAVAGRLGFTHSACTADGYVMPDGRSVDWHHYERTGLELLPPLELSWG